MRVDGVVDQRPADAGGIQRQHDGPVAAPTHGRPPQQRAPVERESQEGLRLRMACGCMSDGCSRAAGQ